jgi:topoisomerase-4 subunit B
MADLFDRAAAPRRKTSYSAKDIEVLEGLDPVRRRPAMYVGGTGEDGLHHLAAEVLDNAVDEILQGAATRVEVDLGAGGTLTVHDNGRGIPVDAHPKFKSKSALEVILTMLHSGGKFNGKAYQTAGGLHGVGLSVVNALSDSLTVKVTREHKLWEQTYCRGKAKTKLKSQAAAKNRRGTTIRFHPDPKIFGDATFKPARLHSLARSKAYLFPGAKIRWRCDPKLIGARDGTPAQEIFHFPGGLADALAAALEDAGCATPEPFIGKASLNGGDERIEWAIAWPDDGTPLTRFYCNAVPTPLGGTHDAGARAALTKGLKAYGALVNFRPVERFTADDVSGGAATMLSLFIAEPQFQGQTKEKLVNPEATKLVEAVLRDHFDHWLTGNPKAAQALLDHVSERANDRLRRREEKDLMRKRAGRKVRLPGKLADCSVTSAVGSELFIVEGDSAGGSAKQARDRKTQAVMPIRGKILNIASAGVTKMRENQIISDLVQALGCGLGERYDDSALRYERIIIMTDADVDGAHIATLLMTFFYRAIPGLIDAGRLYLAQPPLYRLTQGATSRYARDDTHKEELLRSVFSRRGKVDVSRFKGLGEMPAPQLRVTTMDPSLRTLVRVAIAPAERKTTDTLVENLMGRKPELRLAFIMDRSEDAGELDI